jgi:hypothetical protein
MTAEFNAVQAQPPMSDRITVRNVHELFLQMEEAEDLHDSRTANGTHYWDIVRRNVFVSLYGVYGGGFTVPSAPPAERLVSRAKNFAKSLINQATRRYVAGRAPDYVFITAQRIRRGSHLFDPVADHLYELASERAVAVELLNRSAFSYLDMVRGRRTRVPPVSVPMTRRWVDLPQIVERIRSVVRKHFGVSIDVYGPIWEAMAIFEANRTYYLRLFERHRPKAIVCVDNGSLKGMFSAAKERQVPTIELQHGEINKRNIGYSYPSTILSSHNGLALPTVFLTFSDYWNGATHYPVKQVCSVGNDYFYQEKVAGNDDGVLVISAYPYHEALIALALEAADFLGGRTIYYKLHPHQFDQKDTIVAACRGKRNIAVVSDEMDLPELLKRCDFVVGIHSTMTYIALQAGKKVCLYKRSSYFCHDDIFAYVELFDAASELRDIIDSPDRYFHDLSSLPVFFEPFTARRFMETLERVEMQGVSVRKDLNGTQRNAG